MKWKTLIMALSIINDVKRLVKQNLYHLETDSKLGTS